MSFKVLHLGAEMETWGGGVFIQRKLLIVNTRWCISTQDIAMNKTGRNLSSDATDIGNDTKNRQRHILDNDTH